MAKLLILFIVVPALELALLIEVGERIGTFSTLALIAITGVVGATLARWQGLGVTRQIESEVKGGRMPAASMVDGVLILLAAALLVTPGILTDAVGFVCLIPVTRRWIRAFIVRRIQQAVHQGSVRIYSQGVRVPDETVDNGPIIDVRPVEQNSTEADPRTRE